MDFKAEGIQPVYDLFAISNHFGALNGGHYTATCKNAEDGGWYSFNDGSVSPNNGNVCSSSAYMLFYRRRDDVDLSVEKKVEV